MVTTPPEPKVGAISTFLQRLDKIEKTKGRALYFRGHSKVSYSLVPSIFRNEGWIANEAAMLKELIVRCPNDFAGGVSTFQTLVKMQHYGLPTRLLDITSNPLVALYFACTRHGRDDEDGEVIVFDFDIGKDVKYYDSDTVSVIANLCRRPAEFKRPRIADIDKFNADPSIKLLLHDIRQDRPHFEPKIVPDHLGKVICVKPKLDNPRVIRQEGAFLLFGIDWEKTKPAILETRSVVTKIAINKDKKKELAVQLESMGISRASMFPEIEEVSRHIKETYETPDLSILSSLTALQQLIIRLLCNKGAMSIGEIAKRLGILPRSANSVISFLYDKKLVEKVGSGRDAKWIAIDVVKEYFAKGLVK